MKKLVKSLVESFFDDIKTEDDWTLNKSVTNKIGLIYDINDVIDFEDFCNYIEYVFKIKDILKLFLENKNNWESVLKTAKRLQPDLLLLVTEPILDLFKNEPVVDYHYCYYKGWFDPIVKIWGPVEANILFSVNGRNEYFLYIDIAEVEDRIYIPLWKYDDINDLLEEFRGELEFAILDSPFKEYCQ